jgi:hypothetical protein
MNRYMWQIGENSILQPPFGSLGKQWQPGPSQEEQVPGPVDIGFIGAWDR